MELSEAWGINGICFTRERLHFTLHNQTEDYYWRQTTFTEDFSRQHFAGFSFNVCNVFKVVKNLV